MILAGDIRNLDASRNPDSFGLGSPFVTRNMGSYDADIGRSTSDEIFGYGTNVVENGLMTSRNATSSQTVSKKGAHFNPKICLQESMIREVSSKRATSLIGHRRFTFQCMLSGATRPIEMFDFDTGWQANCDANDSSDLVDSSVKHPWIAQVSVVHVLPLFLNSAPLRKFQDHSLISGSFVELRIESFKLN